MLACIPRKALLKEAARSGRCASAEPVWVARLACQEWCYHYSQLAPPMPCLHAECCTWPKAVWEC